MPFRSREMLVATEKPKDGVRHKVFFNTICIIHSLVSNFKKSLMSYKY